MELESYRYIAIDGPIGAGKTSLAMRLATLWGAQALLEQPEGNPFLADSYRDAARHAFQTQVFFLLQRMGQLQAPPEILQARIATRGIAMEEAISLDYLQRLSECYSHFFYHYQDAPVLTVNTEHLDPARNDADLAILLQHIQEMHGPRAFLNHGG